MTADPPSAAPQTAARWFVLQAEDACLGCPVIETRFAVADLDQLLALLGPDAGGDAGLRHGYTLDAADLAALAERFGVAFDAGGRRVTLVPWHAGRDAPYLNHAGFELPLMLEGRKPFAKFADATPSAWLDDRLAAFEPWVAAGRIVRRLIDRPFDPPCRGPEGRLIDGMREVYFALPGQEWRIDAALLLMEVGRLSGWNEALERQEGMLLGYEDWQNDWHLGQIRQRGLTERWRRAAVPERSDTTGGL